MNELQPDWPEPRRLNPPKGRSNDGEERLACGRNIRESDATVLPRHVRLKRRQPERPCSDRQPGLLEDEPGTAAAYRPGCTDSASMCAYRSNMQPSPVQQSRWPAWLQWSPTCRLHQTAALATRGTAVGAHGRAKGSAWIQPSGAVRRQRPTSAHPDRVVATSTRESPVPSRSAARRLRSKRLG